MNELTDYRIEPVLTRGGFSIYYIWHGEERLKQYALSEDEARMRISFHRRVFDIFDAEQELAAWMGVVKHIIQAHA